MAKLSTDLTGRNATTPPQEVKQPSILSQKDPVGYVLNREAQAFKNDPEILRNTFLSNLASGGVPQTMAAGGSGLNRKISSAYNTSVGNAVGDFDRSLAEETQKRLGTYNQLADSRVRDEMAKAQAAQAEYNAEVARKNARNAAIFGIAGGAAGGLMGGPAGAQIGSGFGQGIGGGGLL